MADPQQPSVHVEGGVKGENVVIGGSQTVHGDLTITVGALPTASPQDARTLEELLHQLSDLLNAVPPEHAAEAYDVTVAAQDAIGELQSDSPDPRRMNARLAALKRAAERLGAVAPPILATIEQVAKTISAIV